MCTAVFLYTVLIATFFYPRICPTIGAPPLESDVSELPPELPPAEPEAETTPAAASAGRPRRTPILRLHLFTHSHRCSSFEVLSHSCSYCLHSSPNLTSCRVCVRGLVVGFLGGVYACMRVCMYVCMYIKYVCSVLVVKFIPGISTVENEALLCIEHENVVRSAATMHLFCAQRPRLLASSFDAKIMVAG